MEYIETVPWRTAELKLLIENYIDKGLVGNAEALRQPGNYAKKLATSTASEAVCRILNDFRPLKVIAKSLFKDAAKEHRQVYLAVALSHYCSARGVRRNVLAASYSSEHISALKQHRVPLQIAENADIPEFIVPANGTIASLLVEHVSLTQEDQLLEVFCELADAIAPFVSRTSIRQRTAEARLAGRLFDADGVIEKLLPTLGARFYEKSLERWKWNSRYWEQRALFSLRSNLQLALQYARHAVIIEEHPFPLTTLAKILFVSARNDAPVNSDHFSEALSCIRKVMKLEQNWARGRSKTAYWIFVDGVTRFIESGGCAAEGELKEILRYVGDARRDFGEGSDLGLRAGELLAVLAENGEDGLRGKESRLEWH